MSNFQFILNATKIVGLQIQNKANGLEFYISRLSKASLLKTIISYVAGMVYLLPFFALFNKVWPKQTPLPEKLNVFL